MTEIGDGSALKKSAFEKSALEKNASEMNVTVITLFPEMFAAICDNGITSRALKQGLLTIDFINPREHSFDKHQTVDDRPYGGGPGMVMRVEPLSRSVAAAIEKWNCDRADVQVVYLSPQGKQFDRNAVSTWVEKNHLILICGRYEGVDERFIEHYVDAEWSIGDYVLSGGELAAMVMLDATIRKIPGALGDAQSAEQDSFEEGLLDCPHYTRPEEINGQTVPSVLMSGDHEKIRLWRLQQSLQRTKQRRPDLFEALALDKELSDKVLLGKKKSRLLSAMEDFNANENKQAD